MVDRGGIELGEDRPQGGWPYDLTPLRLLERVEEGGGEDRMPDAGPEVREDGVLRQPVPDARSRTDRGRKAFAASDHFPAK